MDVAAADEVAQHVEKPVDQVRLAPHHHCASNSQGVADGTIQVSERSTNQGSI